jgi:hypothetical protein
MFIFTIGDIIGLAFLAVFVLWAIFIGISRAFSEWQCKHDGGVYETMACHAQCKKCGKDLGFIGTWREKNKLQKQRPEGDL